MTSHQQQWFSVRCVFRMGPSPREAKSNLYEERVTIWRASSSADAIRLAEQEAGQYATDVEAEYLNVAQCFHLFSEEVGSGVEVFSLMRESDLSGDEYVDRFFDTGNERYDRD